LEYYQVAGKTGTARKLVKGDYDPFRHVGSFIGFFPAHDPQLCISVVVDEPQAAIQCAWAAVYGGETAAPVFQRIAERAAVYLAIPPTRSPESSWLTSERAAGQGVSRARAGGANL
jgi:cell division protein FtsI/penicillin-binding protein 2